MKPLLSIVKSLIHIARNLARIVEILEIVHQKELDYHALSQQYAKRKTKEKDSDREFIVNPYKNIDPLYKDFPEQEQEDSH